MSYCFNILLVLLSKGFLKLSPSHAIGKKIIKSSLITYFDNFQSKWDDWLAGVDINICLQRFLDIYNKGVAEFVPLSNVNIMKKNCPWQSYRLKNLICNKKKLWRDVQRSRHNPQDHSLLLTKYKSLNRLVKTTCCEELLLYEVNIASSSVTNPKAFHKFIQNKTVSRDSIRALVDGNDKVVTNPKEICDTLND
jgi:hypothetical protein